MMITRRRQRRRRRFDTAAAAAFVAATPRCHAYATTPRPPRYCHQPAAAVPPLPSAYVTPPASHHSRCRSRQHTRTSPLLHYADGFSQPDAATPVLFAESQLRWRDAALMRSE